MLIREGRVFFFTSVLLIYNMHVSVTCNDGIGVFVIKGHMEFLVIR